eukprot:gene4138-4541_t
MNCAQPVVPPHEFDVKVNVTPEILTQIWEELGSVPLSETSVIPTFPVHGIVFGLSLCVFLPFVVSKRSKAINVNFLVDTACPYTYLRSETRAALGFQESISSGTNVLIHGTAITVYPSANNFEDVDLLGQDYFTSIRASMSINYPEKTVEVSTIP